MKFKDRIKRIFKSIILTSILCAIGYIWLLFNLHKSTKKFDFNVFESEFILEFAVFSALVGIVYFAYGEFKRHKNDKEQ